MTLHNFRLAITGAAGFIGSHTVDGALAAGARVLALDDLSTGRESNLADASQHTGFAFAHGDVADAAFVAAQFDAFRPQAVIHLAGLVSVQASFERPDENLRRNVEATEVVARAALGVGCTRVVFSSSAAVYGDADHVPIAEEQAGRRPTLSPYGAAKARSEAWLQAARAQGLDPAVVRYFNVYGARQDARSPYSGVVSLFLDRAARCEPLVVFGDGGQTRDFIAVEDVVRANLRAADPSVAWPGPCNVCTGRAVSIADIAALIARERSRVVFEPAREGDIRHSLGNPSQLAATLGAWDPVPFAAGLARLVHELA